jgi:hypothetical protein
LTFAKDSLNNRQDGEGMHSVMLMLPASLLLFFAIHILFIDSQLILADTASAVDITPATTIKAPILRELVQANTISGATVSGQERGFALQVKLGQGQKILVTSRGAIRMFASLDTVAAFARDIGLPRFEVDMSGHAPGRLRKARPDRSEAMRHTRTKIQQQPLDFLTGGEP